jgi:hypothetical protein
MPDFLPDLARREWYQLTISKFEEPDANVFLKSTHKVLYEITPFKASIAFVVGMDVYAYQDSESPIPDVVERNTASSANNVVGSQ